MGDREGQIGALKQAIQSDPQFAEGYLFLAKAYLDEGGIWSRQSRWPARASSWRRGPNTPPLGHYVMADAYNRQGRSRDAAQELARGRAKDAQFGGGKR